MTSPVRIPADVDMPDRVIGPLTARQLAILAVTGLVLYAVWDITRAFLPVPVFLALAIPVAATAAVLALGHRDGISLDRLLWAAIRQRHAGRRQVAPAPGGEPVPAAPAWLTAHATTPEGRPARNGGGRRDRGSPARLRLPAQAITAGNASGAVGVVDLGADGLAVVAAASTVSFALRTPAEQEALAAGFGRYLHSLTAPVQILIRAHRLDLTGQIRELHTRAGGLPHPALEAAAVEHADYLSRLGAQADLLRRQVLLVLREPTRGALPPTSPPTLSPTGRSLAGRRGRGVGEDVGRARRAAEARLARRLGEAVELLAPAGIVITPLDAGRATAVLAAACNPDSALPPSAGVAGADEVITGDGTGDRAEEPGWHAAPEPDEHDRTDGGRDTDGGDGGDDRGWDDRGYDSSGADVEDGIEDEGDDWYAQRWGR